MTTPSGTKLLFYFIDRFT